MRHGCLILLLVLLVLALGNAGCGNVYLRGEAATAVRQERDDGAGQQGQHRHPPQQAGKMRYECFSHGGNRGG